MAASPLIIFEPTTTTLPLLLIPATVPVAKIAHILIKL
jgi:hypothetical protein